MVDTGKWQINQLITRAPPTLQKCRLNTGTGPGLLGNKFIALWSDEHRYQQPPGRWFQLSSPMIQGSGSTPSGGFENVVAAASRLVDVNAHVSGGKILGRG